MNIRIGILRILVSNIDPYGSWIQLPGDIGDAIV